MKRLNKIGYKVIKNIYTVNEIDAILATIQTLEFDNKFGVREFLLDQPALCELIFNQQLLQVIKSISPHCDKVIKSIYFDKPPHANWIVNWHQDLTINLLNKKEIEGYKNWRVTDERVIVQPDRTFLENIFTIRIHLDDCTAANGALRVIENSHTQGVIEMKEWMKTKKGIEHVCEVPKGGILVMNPLTLHASRRTENRQNRRVIHLEFTDKSLPNGLEWKEVIRVLTPSKL